MRSLTAASTITAAPITAALTITVLLLAAAGDARAQPCTPCTSCDTDFTKVHGDDNPADYQTEKARFITAFYDVVATSSVSTWSQARAVWHALGERFRKQHYGPEDYIGNCTSCSCRKTWYCTEFVIDMYRRAGMYVRGEGSSDNPISSSRRLFRCAKDKYASSSAVYYRKPSNTSFTPRPGDALVFEWSGYNASGGTFNGVDCRSSYNNQTHTSSAGYCSDHSGMVLGLVGTTLYTVEGNTSGGRVRIKRYTNYRNNTDIVAFIRINTNSLDCR